MTSGRLLFGESVGDDRDIRAFPDQERLGQELLMYVFVRCRLK